MDTFPIRGGSAAGLDRAGPGRAWVVGGPGRAGPGKVGPFAMRPLFPILSDCLIDRSETSSDISVDIAIAYTLDIHTHAGTGTGVPVAPAQASIYSG